MDRSASRRPGNSEALPPRGRETKGRRAERLASILEELHRLYPVADCALDHRNAFELLVATILSAQCTDKTVNLVTPALFERYPDAAALAAAKVPTLEKLIYSTGFYKNKAKNLKAMAERLQAEHGGNVPDTMEALLRLPGVARKTANVVLGTHFGIAVGIVVDTHVGRLARRLGLTREQNPVAVERDLTAQVPRDDWVWISHALIWHGRLVCDARRPKCAECTLGGLCPARAMFATGP
ncbi:MAG: endonuclease III [Planctomycetes bacterium]|nr:endonuclease III [Planctomycetota bacterium]MCB9917240.1 endonuclease III [Planctomycetota bacterium]